MAAFDDRTLLVKPHGGVKITMRLINRRAQEIAALFGCPVVQVMQGSTQNDLPWRFTFTRNMGLGEYRVLVLRVYGTRGQVYTTLGNYLHGAEGMRALLVRDGEVS